MKFLILMWIVCFAMGCSTASQKKSSGTRTPASLDNNSDTVLDPSLEAAQDPDEEKKFNEVAQTIARFVAKQSQLREEHAKNGQQTEEEKSIQNDLPQVDQEGKVLPDEIKRRYATRDVHRKTHGCYAATLDISSQLQEDLNRKIISFINERAQEDGKKYSGSLPEKIERVDQLGIFQPGLQYDAIVRYSNGHPGNRFDGAPDARGMALKILPKGYLNRPIFQTGADALNKETVLDILAINFPTFFVNDPVKYLKINQWFLKGSEDFRDGATALANQTLAIFPKFVTGMTALEQKLAFLSNGSIIYSPTFQKYWSMVPSRLGPHGEARAIKYAFFPEACSGKEKDFTADSKTQWADWTQRRDFALVSQTILRAKNSTPPFAEKYPHDYLRAHTKSNLQKGPACFALMFQLYRDQFSTNIEDSTDIWLSGESDRAAWIQTLKSGNNLSRGYYKKVRAKKFSPYIKAATLKISQIDENEPARNTKTCEDLSFNPWNGNIEFHKPLGIVSRMKRRVYNASRRTRNTINELPTQSWER